MGGSRELSQSITEGVRGSRPQSRDIWVCNIVFSTMEKLSEYHNNMITEGVGGSGTVSQNITEGVRGSKNAEK